MKRIGAILILLLAAFLVFRSMSVKQPASAPLEPASETEHEESAEVNPALAEPALIPSPIASPAPLAQESTSTPRSEAQPSQSASKTAASESHPGSEQRSRMEQAKSSQAVSMKDFLKHDLHLTEEELASYESIKAKSEEELKKATESQRGRQRRQAVRKAFQTRETGLQELMGTVRYPRYKEFEKRQREEMRLLIRDIFPDARPPRGRRNFDGPSRGNR